MSDSIVMVQAFAELRYGVVVHMRENSVIYGHNLISISTKPFTYANIFGLWCLERRFV